MEVNAIIEKFNSLPAEIGLEFSTHKVLEQIDRIGHKYGVELAHIILAVAVGELEADGIDDYLVESEDIDPTISKAIEQDLMSDVFDPLAERIGFLHPSGDEAIMPLARAKEMLFSMFGKSLLEEINNHPVIVRAVNQRVFNVLAKELGFKKDLENSLYGNTEILGRHLTLNGKPASPTIGNWLRSFIEVNGTGLFDPLVISSFVANSMSAKELPGDERVLLLKVLKTYRNIKFFPESMPTDSGEGWQILPVVDEVVVSRREEASMPEVMEDDVVIMPASESEPKGRIDNLVSENIEPKAVEQKLKLSPEMEKHMSELMVQAAEYPVGSLERNAIENEIKRINA